MATNEKPNHFNLAYTDFSTDKAKDNAYMADQQKSDCKYNLRSGCAVAAKNI